MGRVADWPTRLNETVEAWRGKPFEWGKSDCVSFVLAVDAAIYGKAHVKLPKYKSERAALRLISKKGGDLSAAVDNVLSRIQVAQAKRGDVVAVDTPDGPALAVVLGDVVAGMGPDGLVFPPISAAIAAWEL